MLQGQQAGMGLEKRGKRMDVLGAGSQDAAGKEQGCSGGRMLGWFQGRELKT